MSRLIFVLLIALALAGCTQRMTQIDNDAIDRTSAAERLMNTTRPDRRQDAIQPSTVRFSNEVFLGHRSFRRDNGAPLPTRFDLITLASARPLSLPEVAAEITAVTGLPVSFETSFSDTLEEALQAAEAEADGSPGAPQAILQAQLQQAEADSDEVVQRISLNFTGPLKQLLDLLSARFNVTWIYENNQIVFQDFVTQTFFVYALPGSTQVTSGLSAATSAGEGDDGGTSGGTTQEITVESMVQIWDDIEAALAAMTPDNSRISVSRGTGTVTVTTSPVAMRRVASFIQAQNDVLNRQIAITVQILSVTLGEDEVFNFNVDTLFESIEDEFGLGFSGPTQEIPGTLANFGSFSGRILAAPSNPELGRFSGSQAVLQALSQIGRTTLINTAAVTTLNNQVVPVQAVTRTDFIRESATTLTDQGTETELTPGTTVTGFAINLLPRILSSGEIILQYAFSLSDLVELRSVSEGGTTIELPQITSTDFLQQIRMRSGETLVLAGFQEARDDINRTGTGSPNNFLLGGGRLTQSVRETLVLLISPVLLR